MSIKSIVYRLLMAITRTTWRLSGRRKIKVFGHEILVNHDTIFPSYRKHRLPTGGSLSQIVKYGDYVQMHAVCNYVSNLKANSVVIDIGAHHGAYAVLIGKMIQNRSGKVIALEPNPQSFKILRDNVRLNCLERTVICEQLAVSENPGFADFAIHGSQSHIAHQKNENSIPVEVITLKQIIERHAISSVDLLIVDAEGAGLPVLKGFPWESVKIRKIFCELHPYAWKEFRYDDAAMSDLVLLHG